ncbi:MAG TPA: hypothetical protein V6C99_00015 [Oculatellaceae cyanobacterium]|jgi:hypothetical protein
MSNPISSRTNSFGLPASSMQWGAQPQFNAPTSFGTPDFSPQYGGYDAFTPSTIPMMNQPPLPEGLAGIQQTVAKATSGLDIAVHQALQADAQWKQQQAMAAQQQQQMAPQTQPQAGAPQEPQGAQGGTGFEAIDQFDFKSMENMSENELKETIKKLNLTTDEQKEYFVIKFIAELSATKGDDKGLNKIAETLDIDHDDLTDDEFSAHDFHVIRDILNEISNDKLGDIVDNFAFENGGSNRTYIAKALGSDTTGWFGKEYFKKEDFGKVLEALKKGQSINDLIVEGRKHD